MLESIVEKLHADFTSVITLLDNQSEVSLRSVVDDNFRRALLLAAASYFETRLTEHIAAYAAEVTISEEIILEFIRIKGIDRQYHTWFSWEDKNANKFFSLFGASFKTYMGAQLRADVELEASMLSFMEIGRERNRMVHTNFGGFTLEKTADEIFASYQAANRFVEAIPAHLRNCSTRNRSIT